MARTKRVTKPAAEKKQNSNAKIKELILKKLEENEQIVMNKLDKRLEEELKQIENEFLTLRAKFSKSVLNRTMAEIKNGEVDDSQISTVLSDLTNTFNSTRTIANSTTTTKKGSSRNITNSTLSSSDGSDVNRTKVGRPSRSRAKRSVSAGCDDEGYTTAESVRGTTSGGRHNSATRASRSRLKVAKTTSRSLSRTATKKVDSFQTPANKQPPTNAGTITPKCKPNTPLLCVRRPKIGEMAWSNQGSPLLVSNMVAPEQTANINIPVGDDILSMLPTRGPIRTSQMPDVGLETRRQLEILRDNLINYIEHIEKK